MNTKHFAARGPRSKSAEVASAILKRAFEGYSGGIGVRLWDGQWIRLGHGEPDATLVFRDPTAFRALALTGDPLRLAEAYFLGAVDVEGDLEALLAEKTPLQSLVIPRLERLKAAAATVLTFLTQSSQGGARQSGHRSVAKKPWNFLRLHTRSGQRDAIAFHYDVSNEFYQLWLDEQMLYSCAYFERGDDTLDQAQRNKLDHIWATPTIWAACSVTAVRR